MHVKRLVRTRNESGLTIVLVALFVTAMMIFVALAIDVGAAYNQRRQYQSQADAGVLGAAGVLPNESDTGGATQQIIQLVNNNLSSGFSPSDFNTCTSDTPPSTLSSLKSAISWVHPYVDPVSHISYNCIAFDQSGSLVWVEVPRTQPYKTTFGRIAGRASIVIGASAVAGNVAAGFGGVLPFGVALGSTVACLKTGPQTPTPCTGPDTGSFGTLDILEYGNPTMGTTPSCTGNGSGPTGRFANNIALGADHHLSTTPGTRHDDCVTLSPDDISGQPGNSSDFDSGILSGFGFTDGGSARLQRVGTNFQNAWIPTTTLSGNTIDDGGLWTYISNFPTSSNPTPSPIADVPAVCQGTYFNTLLTTTPVAPATKKSIMHDALVNCFNEYSYGVTRTTPIVPCTSTSQSGCGPAPGCDLRECTGVMFDLNTKPEKPFDLFNIQDTPRFAYVPEFTGAVQNCANSWCNVVIGFQAVWLQELFGTCTGGGGCRMDFEPGVGDGPANVGKADAVLGLVFNPNMLPPSLQGNPYQGGRSTFTTLFR